MSESTPAALRLLPALAVLAACTPLLVHGYPRGHDWHLELVRVAEYREAWRAPPRPPAWAGDVYGGFGAPVFVYYAPLFSSLAAAGSRLLDSVRDGAWLALVVLLGVAAWGMQRLVAALAGPGGDSGARVAAMLFVLNPYLLCDAMLRNAGAELAALALAPLPLLGVALLRSRPRAGVALLSMGLALTVLAHNLTALVIAPALLVALALDGDRARVRLGVSAWVLGLALSSFFWVPALAYQPLMRSAELLTGKFDFRLHFAGLAELFGWERFYSLGALPAACLVVAAVGARRMPAGRERRIAVACVAAALGSLWLATPWSRGLWERLPGLPLFQFPWRFLGPLALFSAIAAGLVHPELVRGLSRRAGVAVEIAVLVLCVANAAPTLLRVRPLPATPRVDVDRLDARTIREQSLRVTVGDEYLPRDADAELWRRADPASGAVLEADPGVHVTRVTDRPTRIELEVDAGGASGTRLAVARWSHPGWQLRIDGRPADFVPTPGGTLGIVLPPGRSRVEIEYRGPGLRRAFVPVSAAALVLWGAVVFGPRRSRRRPT